MRYSYKNLVDITDAMTRSFLTIAQSIEEVREYPDHRSDTLMDKMLVIRKIVEMYCTQKFNVGDRVVMTEGYDVPQFGLDAQGKKYHHGWYGDRHTFVTGATATVVDIEVDEVGDVVLVVKFDKELLEMDFPVKGTIIERTEADKHVWSFRAARFEKLVEPLPAPSRQGTGQDIPTLG